MTQACEMYFESLGCREFAEQNPDPETQAKINFCPSPASFQGFQFSLKDCATAFPASLWDDVKSIFEIFNYTLDTETLLRYHAFEDCRTPACKYRNLGPMAQLFSKEEIEGLPSARSQYKDKCADPVYQNACEGMSMEMLYRQIERRAEPLIRAGKLPAKWRPPWLLGQEVYVLKKDIPNSVNETKSLEQIADELLGVRVGCYTCEARTHMMCYAIAMVVDPVGLLKLAKKAKALPGISKDKLMARIETRAAMKEMKMKHPQRYAFVELYHDKLATTPKQNAAFIEKATNPEPGKAIVMYTDNFRQKDLNKTMKAVVTAMNNKRDEIFLEEAEELLKKYPTVERIPYSDYKAVGQRFSVKPPEKSFPPGFEEDLKAMNQRALDRLRDYAKENKILEEDPSEWYRTGFGHTVGEAADASREMRSRGSRETANFNDSQYLKNRHDTLNDVSRYQKEIAVLFGNTPIMREKLYTRGPDFLKKEIFELYRKYPEPENFNKVIRERYGIKADDTELAIIRNYIEAVNTFSPPIMVASRKVVTLNDAYHGGLSIDFAGQGGANLYATAQALSHTRNPKHAIEMTRLEEFHETKDFVARQNTVRERIEEVLRRHNTTARIESSGDDMVVKFNRSVSSEVIDEINQALAAAVPPSSLRITRSAPPPQGLRAYFAGSRTVDDITVQAENIEKTTRVFLEGRIPKSRLDEIGLLIDMSKPSTPVLRRTSRVQLTEKEIQQINQAFEQAVTEVLKVAPTK